MLLAPLELVCFGPPSARLAGRDPPPEVLWRKHLALLIYLALSPKRCRTRDHLVGLLWGERSDEKARHSLNGTVQILRRSLGKDRLQSEQDTLTLNGDKLVVDALKFAAAVQTAPDEAIALWRGEFLEGFHADATHAFDEWMTAERTRYQALGAAALVGAGERRLAEARLAEAGDAARRVLALNPSSEPAVRLLMRAAALAGDTAAALGAHAEFAAALARDVGEQPSRALAAFAERIRSGGWRPAASAVPESPLVGRVGVHREVLDTAAQGLTGGPRSIVITGAAGMGRTRLLAECTRRLALEGALVLQARPVESDHDAPWSALRFLLRSGEGVGLAGTPGLPGASRDALAAVAGLAPALAERFPAREVRDVADMAAALASVLGAVAEERPVALALDDAQWADGASLAALCAAVGGLKAARVVLILTVAEGVDEPPRPLLRLLRDIGRELPGSAVRLAPLNQDDVAALVVALAPWCRDAADRERLTRRLHFESGGSPFMAITLLGALERASTLQGDLVAWPPPNETLDASLPFSVPSLVRHAIAMRVGELTADELAILRAASMCGQVLDVDVIAHTAERSVPDVESALPTFERRQLIQFDGRRYVFTAPIIPDVVRTDCVTRGERRRLECRAIAALAPRGDLESRVLRVELMAHATPDGAAHQLALDVARDAKAIGAERLERRAAAAAERISRAAPQGH